MPSGTQRCRVRGTELPLLARPLKQIALKEAALFFGLLFVGFALMPIGIFVIGKQIFGEYGGYGYADFFGDLSAKIRTGELVAWFLVLSPYLIWQTLRLTIFGWRIASRPRP